METISMEMVASAAPQTGPPESSPDTVQDSSFRDTLAKAQKETGGEVETKGSSSQERSRETAKESPREVEKGRDQQAQEEDQGDEAPVIFSGPMVSTEIPTQEISPSAIPVLPDSLLPDTSETPVDEVVLPELSSPEETFDSKIPVQTEELSLPELTEEKSAVMVKLHRAPELKTTEVLKTTEEKKPLMTPLMYSRETGTKDVPLNDAVQVTGNDSEEQRSAILNRADRGREMAEVPELSKVALPMTGQTTEKAATDKKVLSGKGEISAAPQREISMTEQEIPAEIPQSAKETPMAGRKVVLPDEGGTAWFREGFVATPPQGSFSSEGQLSTEGLGRATDSVTQVFGKEVGQGLLEQVESQLHLMALRGREKITLQLHPAFLGKLKMNVSLQNHHLVAEMTTDSAMTREILSSHVHTLKEALMDQGIRLERFDVHLQDNTEHGESRYQGQAFQEQARQQQPGRSYSGTFLSEDVPTHSGIAEVSPGATAMAAASPGINLFV